MIRNKKDLNYYIQKDLETFSKELYFDDKTFMGGGKTIY